MAYKSGFLPTRNVEEPANIGYVIKTQTSGIGSNIYILDHAELPAEYQALEDRSRAVSNSWVGQMYKQVFPGRALDPDMVCAFYAYASACYLDRLSNTAHLGVIKFQPNDIFIGEVVQSALTRNPDPPHLPSKITFLSESQDGQWTNCAFLADNFTNINGVSIPQIVKVVRYNFTNRKMLTEYTYSASYVSGHCSLQDFTPVLPDGSVVSDYRFAHGGGFAQCITFLSTSNGWPTEAMARQQPEYTIASQEWYVPSETRKP